MSRSARDPQLRFSDRVDDYVRYRPNYPAAVAAYLIDLFGLTDRDAVADVGSGTGIFTEMLLDRNLRVYAIEPNAAMREAAERQLSGHAHFTSVAGSAESTGLLDASCAAVFAVQAFHWFDREAARREFRRILRPPGFCAVIWNERLVDVDPFSREYEQLLIDCGIDYCAVDHRQVGQYELESFFGSADFSTRRFENDQELDLDGLIGRLRSSSYMPSPGHPRYDEMIAQAEDLFSRRSDGGCVRIRYETVVHAGRLHAD